MKYSVACYNRACQAPQPSWSMDIWRSLSRCAQDVAVQMTMQQLVDGRLRVASKQEYFFVSVNKPNNGKLDMGHDTLTSVALQGRANDVVGMNLSELKVMPMSVC